VWGRRDPPPLSCFPLERLDGRAKSPRLQCSVLATRTVPRRRRLDRLWTSPVAGRAAIALAFDGGLRAYLLARSEDPRHCNLRSYPLIADARVVALRSADFASRLTNRGCGFVRHHCRSCSIRLHESHPDSAACPFCCPPRSCQTHPTQNHPAFSTSIDLSPACALSIVATT
jgi:hypothetical protein